MPSALWARVAHGGEKHGKDFVNGGAADPGLDSKPAAGDECAQEGRDVGADSAEGGAAVNREGDAVVRSGVGVEHHRDEHDEVGQEDGENCFGTNSFRRR